jgi:hypothetical protein
MPINGTIAVGDLVILEFSDKKEKGIKEADKVCTRPRVAATFIPENFPCSMD